MPPVLRCGAAYEDQRGYNLESPQSSTDLVWNNQVIFDGHLAVIEW